MQRRSARRRRPVFLILAVFVVVVGALLVSASLGLFGTDHGGSVITLPPQPSLQPGSQASTAPSLTSPTTSAVSSSSSSSPPFCPCADAPALFEFPASLDAYAAARVSSKEKHDPAKSLFKAAAATTDDLAIVAGTGQRIFVATALEQIHHGIYKTLARVGLPAGHPLAADGAGIAAPLLRFAFKAECRPPSKWHGQQGWGEVAAHRLLDIFADEAPGGSFRNTIPYAVGGVVFVPPSALKSIVHRDGCGAMSDAEAEAWLASNDGSANYATRFRELRSRTAKPLVPLVGVLLAWVARHDDNALPPKRWGPAFFQPPSAQAPLAANAAAATDPEARRVLSASTTMLLDYVLGNEDREDKNWFTAASSTSNSDSSATAAGGAAPFVMMDNGWVFSGREYRESMCGRYAPLLECPPLLRYLAPGNSKGGGGGGMCERKGLVFCRAEAPTLALLRRVEDRWEAVGQRWIAAMWADPLMRFLLTAHGRFEKGSSVALARVAGRECEGVAATGPSRPLHLLAAGVEGRLKAALAKFDECGKRFGEAYVHIL